MAESVNHFFGLDIGTSKVRCVVGMLDSHEEGNSVPRPSIIGHGSAPNVGMRKGVVVHVDDVVEAVVQAVNEAERVSGIHIASATVNVNGSHVTGFNSKGVIAISTANREITSDDRFRVEEAATIIQLPPNREIIQVFAKNYRLDGQDNIKDPVGMQGIRLEVDTHIVTAATPNLRSLDQVLSSARITPVHHTVSSLGAAEAVLTRQQKEAGTLLLDIGAGTTNIAVIEDGEVQHIAVIPMGGINVTNDLAIGLKTDLDVAEAVKLEHATLREPKPGRASVVVDKMTHSFERDDIYMITEARIDELLEFVDKELKRVHRSRKLPGGVVLVGGSAKLPGLAEFTREKLQLAARIGSLQNLGGLIDTVQDSAYIPAVGLMLLDMLLMPQTRQPAQKSSGASPLSLVHGAFKRLRRR